MRRVPLELSTLVVPISAGAVVLGVGAADGYLPTARTIVAVVLVTTGLVGIVSSVADRSVDAVRLATRRWWAIAFVAFLPYGLATAPSSEQAAAVGDAFAGPIAASALEAVAGAAILCAVATTVLYLFARHGIYPGQPSPEERLLGDRPGD